MSLKTTLIALAGGLLGMLSCARATHEMQRPGVIVDALLAQVEGAGGCVDLATIAEARTPFLRNVTIVKGVCLSQHADTLRPTIAVDSMGLVYLLHDEEDLRFLTRRHPVENVTTESIMAFGRFALDAMDRLTPECTTILSLRDVPPATRASLAQAAQTVTASRLEWTDGSQFVVWLSALCGNELRGFEFIADTNGYFQILAD